MPADPPAAERPVGPLCPGCGQHGAAVVLGELSLSAWPDQMFCLTDDCPWFLWNPNQTLAQLNSHVRVIDFPDLT